MRVTGSDDNPVFSVIIPARDEGERIRNAVDSIVLGRSCVFPLQIVIVDDASSDNSCASLPNSHSWSRERVCIDVIRLPRWSGIPYARNIGAAHAQASTLFITDANVRFPSGWDLHIRHRSGPNRVLCATIADMASPFRGYGGTLHIPSMGFSWLRTPAAYGGYVPLAPCTGTVIPTELFRQAGGYDTAMPVYGAAEPEFSVRLWLSGAEIVSVPGLVLEHRFRPASERRPFLEAISLLELHNYMRFGILYLDPPRIQQMFHYYCERAPSIFRKALHRVWTGDVWQRRDVLQRNLPGRFDSFVKRFGVRDARGELAAQVLSL